MIKYNCRRGNTRNILSSFNFLQLRNIFVVAVECLIKLRGWVEHSLANKEIQHENLTKNDPCRLSTVLSRPEKRPKWPQPCWLAG